MEIHGVSVFISFAAGLFSFVSPCVLPLVPAFLAYLAGTTLATEAGPPPRGRVLLHATYYVLGFSLLFIAFGATLGVAGYALRDHQRLLERIAGAFLIFMGLHMMRLLPIPWLYQERHFDVPAGERLGYVRSFSFGVAFAVGWTPCVGPTLGAILGLAATSSTAAQGALLLAIYSFGLAVPFLLVALALGSARRGIRRLGPVLPRIALAGGGLLIFLGVIVFTGQFLRLNRWFADLGGLGANI